MTTTPDMKVVWRGRNTGRYYWGEWKITEHHHYLWVSWSDGNGIDGSVDLWIKGYNYNWLYSEADRVSMKRRK